MMITTHRLTRMAGLSAVVGGLLYVGVQVKHPLLDATFTTTVEYATRETAKIVMALLSLVGITGIYLRQVRQSGLLGLIGYVLLALGYLSILGIQIVGVFVLPDLATVEPGYVNDALAVATSGVPVGDVSGLRLLSRLAITYIVGGTVFGIALFRANVLPRWAAVLLSLGALATIATFQLPELVQRLFAVPVGVALIGLGWSLWRERGAAASTPASTGSASTHLDPAGAR
jgi:hypothetical protein